MLKIILVGAVLLGAAWAYGPTRERIASALVPVAERLGPVGDLVAAPVRRYTVQTELDFIADQILMHRTEGREVPTEQTFQTWLKKTVKTRWGGKDAWGSPYFLTQRRNQTAVGSVGPDGQRGTEDDLREPVVY